MYVCMQEKFGLDDDDGINDLCDVILHNTRHQNNKYPSFTASGMV